MVDYIIQDGSPSQRIDALDIVFLEAGVTTLPTGERLKSAGHPVTISMLNNPEAKANASNRLKEEAARLGFKYLMPSTNEASPMGATISYSAKPVEAMPIDHTID